MLCSNLCALMFKFMRPVMTSVGSYFPLAIQLGKKIKKVRNNEIIPDTFAQVNRIWSGVMKYCFHNLRFPLSVFR